MLDEITVSQEVLYSAFWTLPISFKLHLQKPFSLLIKVKMETKILVTKLQFENIDTYVVHRRLGKVQLLLKILFADGWEKFPCVTFCETKPNLLICHNLYRGAWASSVTFCKKEDQFLVSHFVKESMSYFCHLL